MRTSPATEEQQEGEPRVLSMPTALQNNSSQVQNQAGYRNVIS
jgi:hypothetical protein